MNARTFLLVSTLLLLAGSAWASDENGMGKPETVEPMAPENALVMDCATTTGQVCTMEGGCEAEAAGAWRMTFVMNPEQDGPGVLRRVLVVNVKRGTLAADQTLYQMQGEASGIDGRLFAFAGRSGADATDYIVTGEGGGFVAVKSSQGLFTSRMGSCSTEMVPKVELVRAIAARAARR